MKIREIDVLPPEVKRHVEKVLASRGWSTMAPIAKTLCRGCPGAANGPDDAWICASCPLSGISISVAIADRLKRQDTDQAPK